MEMRSTMPRHGVVLLLAVITTLTVGCSRTHRKGAAYGDGSLAAHVDADQPEVAAGEQPGEPKAQDAAPVAPGAPRAAGGEAELVLKARVNNGEAEALIGTPLSILAVLSSTAAQRALNENQQRRAEGQEPVDVPAVRIGTNDSPWVQFLQFSLVRTDGDTRAPEDVLKDVDWREFIPEQMQTDTQLQEVGAQAARVLWVLPPDACGRLAAGQYELRARFGTSGAAEERLPKLAVQSKPARLRLRRAATDGERSTVLLGQASYSLNHERDFEEATALAKSALQVDPLNGEAHVTLGSVYRLQHRWEEAIAEYRAYLEYLEQQDLPPAEDGPIEHAREMIRSLEKRLQEETG